MTPPDGPDDDPAGSEPSDRGGAERDEDPKLRAMRAVWLSMRDEDPPDRGLAELLAAARSKAEAMTPQPSWWQRLLAATRRPPVLALATAVVLITGAVLVGRRTADEADHAPARPSATMPANAPAPARETAKPEPIPELPSAAPQGTAAGRARASDDRADLRVDRDAPTPPPPAAQPPPPPPVSHAPPPPAKLRGPEPTRRPAPTRPVDALSPYDSDAGGASGRGAATGSAAAGDDDLAGSKAIRSLTKAGPSAPPDSLRQLYRQCEVAAQRGDCPTVRRLVERITRSERDYPARAARDPAIAKCLE
ncbi:MAG TPA: hypothetical protein VK607_02015 [Kofleriaceae bacterium]|nr:hypothetical protein [Kofleriaceae bacterium]